MENVDAIGSKELDTPKIWEIKKHPEDEYGFIRTEYKFGTPFKDNVDSIIFKDPNDDFIKSSDSVVVINRDLKSIVNFVQDELHQDVPEEIRSGNPIWSDNKREVIESLAATSLFNMNGTKKEYLDYSEFEGSALIFAWLAYRNKDPNLSEQAFDALIERRKYLPRDKRIIREIDPDIDLGEIHQDKIYATHTTDYLPFINKDTGKIHILPRVDTDGVPRWTVHMFVNGMVEAHSVNGFNSNSWENRKYLIGMKFTEVIRDNGLPANFFKADTFWSLNPGTGLIVPPGSFIIMPEAEVENITKYQELGFVVKTYDSENGESVRTAAEHYYSEKNISVVNNIDPKAPGYVDREFASRLGVKSTTHATSTYDGPETDLISSQVNGPKMREAKKLSISEDNDGKLNDVNFDNILTRTWYKRWLYGGETKKRATSIALRDIYKTISEQFYEGDMCKEALFTAVTTNII